MITITINGQNRTSDILLEGFKISDKINSAVNTLVFELRKPAWPIAIGQEISVDLDETLLFAGIIVKTERYMRGIAEYMKVECADWTHLLEQKITAKRYRDTTLGAIIADLLADEMGGEFTMDNVQSGATVIKSALFDNITVADALQKLARTLNFFWYADYEKDIHFFPKNQEPAPFNLTDTNGKYVFESLMYQEDLSQLRNAIKVRGGDYIGESKTERKVADGTSSQYALINKFSNAPVITVDGVEKTVGVEFLDKDEDFQIKWDFNQKYIRFTAGNIPAADAEILITGTPLIPLVATAENQKSIEKYGRREFYYEDRMIGSIEELRRAALAQLESYKDGIVEAEFLTNENGLRAGHVITVQSNIRNIDETFLVMSVATKAVSPSLMIHHVELATTRTMNMVEFLQEQIRRRDIIANAEEILIRFLEEDDAFSVIDEDPTVQTKSPPYFWVGEEAGMSNPIKWNLFTWANA